MRASRRAYRLEFFVFSFVKQSFVKHTSLLLLAVLLPLVSASADEAKRYIIFPKHETSSALGAQSMADVSVSAEVAAYSVLAKPVVKRIDDAGAVVVSATDDEVNLLTSNLDSQGFIIEPDYERSITLTPNDPSFAAQPDMPSMFLPQAWNVTQGSSSVVIGVIDTGIDYNHPDIAANMWVNPGEIAGNNIDDDGNGYVDDIHGANFISGTGNPNDDQYHGTHVAGTIGAVGNNGIGVAGVNWRVKMVALKFLSSRGSGNMSDAIEAMYYAIALKQRGVNIRVLNGSYGGGGQSEVEQRAFRDLETAGILFVAAAGNAKNDNDVIPFHPASYPEALAVAALTDAGALASFSNYGLNKVAVAAPGVNVLSTFPTYLTQYGGYARISGTSMAAPHVAGLAGLILSVHPNLTLTALRAQIKSTVQPLSALAGKISTGGRVHALQAVSNLIRLSGTVKHEDTPLSGVLIQEQVSGAQTVTDLTGSYYFTGLADGANYNVKASLSGYTFSPNSKAGQVSGTAVADFTVGSTPSHFTLSGTLKKSNGAGVANVTVKGGSLGNLLTDANGRFSFPAVPAFTPVEISFDNYRYVYSPNSFSRKLVQNINLDVAVYDNQFRVDVSVGTPEGDFSSGKFVGLEGVGFTSAELEFYGGTNGLYSTQAEAPDTEYSFTASKTGYNFAPSGGSGVLKKYDWYPLKAFKQNQLYALGGWVLNASANVRLAGVVVDAGPLGTAVTDANGRFDLPPVPYGTPFSISGTKDGFTVRSISGVYDFKSTINGVPSQLTMYAYSGTTLPPDGFDPVPGDKVFVWGGFSEALVDNPLPFTISDIDVVGSGGVSGITKNPGTYSALVDKENPFSLKFQKPGYEFYPAVISAAPLSESQINIAAFRTGTTFVLQGRVADQQGSSVAGVTVDGGNLGTTTTDSGGWYQFRGVPYGSEYRIVPRMNKKSFFPSELSGSYNILASISGAANLHSLNFKASNTGTPPTSNVKLKGLVEYQGKPLGDVKVRSDYGSVRTDSKGRFTLKAVPRGTLLRLSFTKKNYNFPEKTVEMNNDRSMSVNASKKKKK